MRSGGALAVAIGAALGFAAALAGRNTTKAPAPRPPTPAATTAEPATSSHADSNMPSANSSPSPAPSADSSPPSADSSPPSPSPAPSASVDPTFPLVTAPPAVTTPSELEQAERRCYDKRPEECERAADAYESGHFGAADATRASHLRKVALTFLVRACEKRSPHACLVLAGRFETGTGVAADKRRASALLKHARELCAHSKSAECVAGEPR